MSMNLNGCTTCNTPGSEKYEAFTLRGLGGKPKKAVQYDYRHTNGELFSCVAPTLEAARQKRDNWLRTNG